MTVSTHVLDAVRGTPAVGMQVTLDGNLTRVTDDGGRIASFGEVEAGTHHLVFDTSGYSTFYPEVAVTFTAPESGHVHVPLLLSPFAYSTYRGS